MEHGPTRDDVMAWAKEQARIETEKYELEKENLSIPVVFHPNRKIPHGERRCFDGGYLFLQMIYYELGMNRICRKIRSRHHYQSDYTDGLIYRWGRNTAGLFHVSRQPQ